MVRIIKYSIGHIPGRKKPCIMKNTPGKSYIVGSFKNEKEAQEFEQFIKAVIEILRSPSKYEILDKISYLIDKEI